jgi:hypothetical protein
MDGREIIVFFQGKYLNSTDISYRSCDCFVTVYFDEIEIIKKSKMNQNSEEIIRFKYSLPQLTVERNDETPNNYIILNIDYPEEPVRIVIEADHWDGIDGLIDRFNIYKQNPIRFENLANGSFRSLGKAVLWTAYQPILGIYGEIFITDNEIMFVFESNKEYFLVLRDADYKFEFYVFGDDNQNPIIEGLQYDKRVGLLPDDNEFISGLSTVCFFSKERLDSNYNEDPYSIIELIVNNEQCAQIENLLNAHNEEYKQRLHELAESEMKEQRQNKIARQQQKREAYNNYVMKAKEVYLLTIS